MYYVLLERCQDRADMLAMKETMGGWRQCTRGPCVREGLQGNCSACDPGHTKCSSCRKLCKDGKSRHEGKPMGVGATP